MIVNDNFKKARLTLTNFATSGTIGTAANTIDKVSVFLIPQTTAGITLTLPTPTTLSTFSDVVEVINTGTASITVASETISPSRSQTYMWSGTAWLPQGSLAAGNDFWRSGAGGTTLPDGTTDTTENIRRNGNVGINTDPTSALHVVGTGAMIV